MKKSILMLGTVCLLVACNSKTEVKSTEARTVNKDSIKTVISGMEARYAKGMETHNIDDIMFYYADDIKSFDSGDAPVIGAAELRKTMTEMFETMPKGTKVKMETNDIVVSGDGSLVTEDGRYVAMDSTDTQFSSGSFLATFELRDGAYKCVREMIAKDKK